MKAAERAHTELQFTKSCHTGTKGGLSETSRGSSESRLKNSS